MSDRTSWRAVREEILGRPGAGAAYEAARIRFELETGGTMPTLVVLERLASAPGMRLTVELGPLDRASRLLVAVVRYCAGLHSEY
ncbi:hypothetical protein [Kitasatospora purpeofusca]|uniref:hypothetical protein n=1 Tax=Kitasatospora purpeofusca TaxID=67352 RepID=UPI003F4A93E0